ncbi:MAG: DUF1329 domain-containing protein [Candidatus Binatia bacterium]
MKRHLLWMGLILVVMNAEPIRSVVQAEESVPQTERSWRTVKELSPEDLLNVDLRTDTPRHAEISYLPAEPYPFTAPYTAEEMGYRLMEFTQRPRWSCAFANVWGSISPEGVLLSPGKSVTFMDYHEPNGVGAEFLRKPGEELYRYLNQNIFPPDAEGSQRMTIRYRTDQAFVKKEDAFVYSSSIRRVRHQAPSRRQDKFPNQAQTMDDSTGRDAWEFSWRLVGTDILTQTIRFPVTRPTIVLSNGKDGDFREVATSQIKLMGDTYPHYTANNGVECYVVEARAREDWLPNYYAPRILYWLDKHSFYPLRIEQYGRDGNLALVEVRLTDMFNPTLGERGYGPLMILYWDSATDVMSYMVRDNHRLKQWTPEEKEVFFNPDFMRRRWYLDSSVKSQSEVAQPDLFFLRPDLEKERFPEVRRIQLPVEVVARVQAQEAAGRLVFELNESVPEATTIAQPTEGAVLKPRTEMKASSEKTEEAAVRSEQPQPVITR